MRKKFDLSLLPDAPNFYFEKQQKAKGHQSIVGMDEAGRGPWAGPVTAGAIILPINNKTIQTLKQVRDSKQLSHKKRKFLFEIITQTALAWHVVHISSQEIDQIGIMPATKKAMKLAVEGLKINPDSLLIDAVKFPKWKIPQLSLIKGDQRSLSIAAASILAKVSRDRLMKEYALTYPNYGFAQHKGYGTKKHREALSAFGPCLIHRKTYKPIKNLMYSINDNKAC